MDHLNKVDILTQEIVQMTFDENDPPTESVPEELRLWWKATESCLEFIMSQPVTDSDEISTLFPLIWGSARKSAPEALRFETSNCSEANMVL